MSGTLVLCGTPIGNLSDSSARLGEALGSADVVFAEDTRRTAKLLRHLNVDTPMRSYFVGNEEARENELRERLEAGETVALVTDAGMPAVADPGYSAVDVARSAGALVTVVPGPSALTAAVAVSGLPSHRFVHEGFLPRSGGKRRDRLEEMARESRTFVVFSTKQRLEADLTDLGRSLGGDRRLAVTRELTKMHEEVWWGTISEAALRWAGDEARGEFTLVVEGRVADLSPVESALVEVQKRVEGGESTSRAVRDVAEEVGISRRLLYEATIAQDG